ncbi:MAG: TldD/PmbA family protein [Planctomycetes bacterium]|nr:TldD/PmbA family protein [Planctomycetota bacterium]
MVGPRHREERPEVNKECHDLFRTLAERVAELLDRERFDYYDIRIVQSSGSSLMLQDGRLERSSFSTGEGISVRVYAGGVWAMASSDSLLKEEAESLVPEVRRLATSGNGATDIDFGLLPPGERQAVADEVEVPPEEVSPAEKVGLLRKLAEEALRTGDERVVNHTFSYSDGAGASALASSRGSFIYSERSRVMLGCNVVAREEGMAQSWSERLGGIGGYERVMSVKNDEFGIRAVREALTLLRAPAAPGGKMPVILDPSVTGLFIHECLGHNAEADLVLEGQSLLDSKRGQSVASDLVTVIDDPTLRDGYGYHLYDAEGTPTRPTTIIRDGVLECYLHSIETALKMKEKPNGHARQGSYAARALPRMSNTFVAPGGSSLEELVSQIDKGLLLSRGESGYVLSEKGEYVCRAETGQIIEKGKLGERVRETSFNGRVLETLHNTAGLGNKLEVNDPGMCGKEGQSVAVDSGGPHMLVSELVVGGFGEETA